MLTNPPETLQSDFSAIKAKKDNDYQNNQSIWNVFWSRASINNRLESGDPTIMNVWGNNPATLGSGNYYFNRCRPIGLMLSGYQRKNRKSTVVVPLENGDNVTSDQYTKLILNIYKKEDVYELISEAFHEGAIISGINLLQVYLDFTNDPLNGDPKYRNLAYNEFMIDPYFRNPDLSDCNFILVRSEMTKPQVASIMPPQFYDAIMALSASQQGSNIDGRFQYQASAMGYSLAPKVAYDEYWYRDYRKQKKLYDLNTGEMMDISAREDLNIDQLLADNPSLRVEEKFVPTVRLMISCQDKVFYDGPNPLGIDNYPFVAVLGYYNKSLPYMYNRIQSVMTSLLSPQILFNRRIILNADFLESVVNSGWMFKMGAVVDPKHLLQTGQGKLMPLKDSATPLVDVVPIPPPQVPPSAFQQLEVYDKEFFNVSALSQENLGKVVEDDSSGYQSALRTAAGLTAQQPLFDRLDLSQNMLGNLTMEIIQNNWTPGKVKRLLGGVDPAPQFYDKAFGKYHCAVELGFNTETQQQMEFGQMLMLRNAGIQITDAQMIRKATIQGKDEIIQEMNQVAQQQQQMKQMQQQVQMQELQARSELNKARAAADMGLYAERTSRVEENRALAIRQLHEANRDDSAATLDMVRTIKELESIDINHLKELVSLAQLLKSGEQRTVTTEERGELAESEQRNTQPAPNGSALDRGTTL
jgi:hypothetical protein